MNKTKNNLQKFFAILILSGLTLLIIPATASADGLLDWLWGDSLNQIMVIIICVAVLALIGLFVYMRYFSGVGQISEIIKK